MKASKRAKEKSDFTMLRQQDGSFEFLVEITCDGRRERFIAAKITPDKRLIGGVSHIPASGLAYARIGSARLPVSIGMLGRLRKHIHDRLKQRPLEFALSALKASSICNADTRRAYSICTNSSSYSAQMYVLERLYNRVYPLNEFLGPIKRNPILKAMFMRSIIASLGWISRGTRVVPQREQFVNLARELLSNNGVISGTIKLYSKDSVFDLGTLGKKGLIKAFLNVHEGTPDATARELLSALIIAHKHSIDPSLFKGLTRRQWAVVATTSNGHVLRALLKSIQKGDQLSKLDLDPLHHPCDGAFYRVCDSDPRTAIPRLCRAVHEVELDQRHRGESEFDFSKATLTGIARRCREWHRRVDQRQAEDEIARMEDPNKEYDLRFPEGCEIESLGIKIVTLKTPAEMIREGAVMHHCVGTYATGHWVRDGQFYSIRHLRKPDEDPIATVQLNRSARIDQMYGKHNTLVPQRYYDAFLEWLNSWRNEEHDHYKASDFSHFIPENNDGKVQENVPAA